MSIRLDTVPALDRKTGRQTELVKQYRACMLTRDEKFKKQQRILFLKKLKSSGY